MARPFHTTPRPPPPRLPIRRDRRARKSFRTVQFVGMRAAFKLFWRNWSESKFEIVKVGKREKKRRTLRCCASVGVYSIDPKMDYYGTLRNEYIHKVKVRRQWLKPTKTRLLLLKGLRRLMKGLSQFQAQKCSAYCSKLHFHVYIKTHKLGRRH